MSVKRTYEAQEIKILSGLEAVRKRPSMYIGDLYPEGMHRLLWYVLDNAVKGPVGTRVLEGSSPPSGKVTKIEVYLSKDMNTVCVYDNGPGFTAGKHPKIDKSYIELLCTELYCGMNTDAQLAIVNALSGAFTVVTQTEGKIFKMEFTKGNKIRDPIELGPSTISGTKITFTPDKEIFKGLIFNEDLIKEHLKSLENKDLEAQLYVI